MENPPPRKLRDRFSEARYYLRYLRPIRGLVALIVILSLTGNFLRLPVTFIPKVLLQNFDDKPYLWVYFGCTTAAILAAGMLSLLQGYCSLRLGEHLARAIRLDVFAQLERLSILSVGTRGVGQFVQRTVRDVEQIRDLFKTTMTSMITESLRLTVLVAVMLWLDPILTLVLVGIYLLVGPFVRRINFIVERLARRIQLLGENSIDQMVECVGGFRDIQASGRFDRFYKRYEDVVRQTEKTCVRAGLWAHIAGSVPTIMMGIIVVVPYFLAVGRLESVKDVGQVITYVMFLAQAMPIFTQIVRSTSLLARATPALRQVRLTLDPPASETSPEASIPDAGVPAVAQSATQNIELPIQSIRFDRVGIQLGGRWILKDASFEIPGGKFTAVVGQSGAGKTTVFMMLLRLLTPTKGNIWINDTPLQNVPLEQLRNLIGFIPQTPFIFNQTLRENLLIAARDDQQDDVLQRAIEFAQLDDMVNDRQNEGGLDASAGHMGANLSGGEKQRIALGRLVIQDPQIVVCDEYTANIDVKTARLIHESIHDRFHDRTRVVITHELYTVKGADHIVVLDDGQVAQTGVHDELLERPGLYRDMWNVQTLS